MTWTVKVVNNTNLSSDPLSRFDIKAKMQAGRAGGEITVLKGGQGALTGPGVGGSMVLNIEAISPPAPSNMPPASVPIIAQDAFSNFTARVSCSGHFLHVQVVSE